ncbi:uncharacterized protein LOC128248178 isoform X2 [Octopus bimaculoides]|uniref:uncharacterized protein LOC128248178 isoform X2 n=1 Tax=Octopus bimaculoides TaxID=37653 RepID=UPI0022E75302|nr:uncharacterized protein LOC128248178 isoform X2 [Octopus bimaculoides]
MNIYPILLFPVAVMSPGIILHNTAADNCTGCYYDGHCFCSNQLGLHLTQRSCLMIECKKHQLLVHNVLCKDHSGHCMRNDQVWPSVYYNICVTHYCETHRLQTTLATRFDLICTADHILMHIMKFYYPEMKHC